jgi:hypothetical protein
MTYAHDAATIDRPFGELLKESYARMALTHYFQTKWEDVKTLFAGGEVTGLESPDFRKLLVAFESGTFFHLFFSLGVVNLGFLCRFFAKKTSAVRFADQCFWMIAGSVLFWMMTLYQPGATWIHQWSLASVLILYVISVIYMVEGRPKLVYPLLALQAIGIFPLLILAKPWTEETPGAVFDAPLDFGMAAIALVALGGIVYFGWHAKLAEVT